MANNSWVAIAEEKGHKEIAQLLKKTGAEGYKPIKAYPSKLPFDIRTESIWFTDGGREVSGTINALYREGPRNRIENQQDNRK